MQATDMQLLRQAFDKSYDAWTANGVSHREAFWQAIREIPDTKPDGSPFSQTERCIFARDRKIDLYGSRWEQLWNYYHFNG